MKKSTLKIKLLIVLFLTLSFIMLGRTNCSYCTDEGTFEMDAKINPIYENVLSKEEKEYIKEELDKEDTTKERSNNLVNSYDATTYTSYSKFVNALKSNMVKRKTKITFVWKQKKYYNEYTYTNFIEEAILNAMSEKYAKTSDEGNYLRLHFGGYGYKCIRNYNKKTKYYTYTTTINTKYYTTANQEAQLNKIVNNYIKSYKNTGKKSKYQIISDFNDYVCNNVTYDYANLNNSNYLLKYTAYAALVKGTAVCQGYATLYYKLLDNMGMKNTVVTSNQLNHIWNLVEYNGEWYQVDTTWNDGDDKAPYTSYLLWGVYDHPTSDHNYSDVTINWGESTPSYSLAYHGINVDPNVKVNDFTVTSLEEENPTLNWTVPAGVDGVVIKDADTAKILGKFTNTQTSMPVSNVIIGKEYNFEISTYKVVAGKEQYSIPTKITAFTRPNALSGIKASSAGPNYITLAWNKYPTATITGYKVYKYNPATEKYEYCMRTTATSCKVTGLKTLNNYNFKVVAYLKVNGTEYNGKDVVVLTAGTSTKVPAISKLSTKKKKVTVNWKKISGATGYEIYMRKGTKGSYKKIKTANSRTVKFTKSGLKKGTKYYFKIRTYRMVNGKKVYSSCSKVKSIKVK